MERWAGTSVENSGPCGILQRGALPDFNKMPVHNRQDDHTGFRELRPAMAHKTVVADGHPIPYGKGELREAVLAHMQKRGLTQTEAARQIGVNQPQLSLWLAGKSSYKHVTALIARCDALHGRAWLTSWSTSMESCVSLESPVPSAASG